MIPYLLGSISTSLLVSRVLFRDDVRLHGSHNAGLTNMFRVYGAKGAVPTLLGDIAKSVIAVYFGGLLIGLEFYAGFSFGYGGYVAAVACVLGHIWPIFYGFRGGKGVLCSAVSVALLCPRVAVVLIVLFIGLVALTKYISLGSCVAAGMFPIVLPPIMSVVCVVEIEGTEIAGVPFHITAFSFGIAFLVIWCHRANLRRLWNGEESKFSFHRKKVATPAVQDEEEA